MQSETNFCCRCRLIAAAQVNINSSSYIYCTFDRKIRIHVQVVAQEKPVNARTCRRPNAFYYGIRIRDNWTDELNWRLQLKINMGLVVIAGCPNRAPHKGNYCSSITPRKKKKKTSPAGLRYLFIAAVECGSLGIIRTAYNFASDLSLVGVIVFSAVFMTTLYTY